jgi:formate dehydrogenase subunit gamma
VSATAKNLDDRARGAFARVGTTRVRRGELLRHPVYTRVLHWSVAISFILSLLTGFAVFSPWLFHWIAPIFGGGPRARALHPWFGLAFSFFFLFQCINWAGPMAWGEADRRWLRRLRKYITNEELLEGEDVGFFNAGQKLYFWTIVVCGVLFLITGILMWFDHVVGRWIVAISYVVHDVAALVMLAGFIIHIYESTAHQPGTFRSMIEGTVTESWAWTHHPAWFRAVTGRDPREAYEQERRRLEEREDLRRQPEPRRPIQDTRTNL